MTLQSRLNGHFLACAALMAAGTMASQASASIVYSGIVNMPVANNVNGIYLNLVTGARNANDGSNGAGAAPGWDINIYDNLDFYASGNPGYTFVGVTGGNVTALVAGSPINPATSTGTGTAFNTSWPTAPGAYYGFSFQNEAMGNAIQYGWVQYVSGVNGGTIIDYAYDNTGAGLNAGQVPTPGSAALLGLGALGLVGRRRR